MATTKAQQRAVNKYIGGHYDRLNITIPKGHKSTVESAAAAAGESVNGYVQRAILDRMGLEDWPVIQTYPEGNNDESNLNE